VKISDKSVGNFFCNCVNKLSALSHNGEKSENPVLDPDVDPDHHQNIAHSDLGQSTRCSCKNSSS